MALGPTAWAQADDGPAAAAPPGAHAEARSSALHFLTTSPTTSPTAFPTASSSPEESPLAGRLAGEGRARPGRSLSPLEAANSEAAADEMPPDPDPAEVPAFTPPPGAFPEPGETARQRRALDEPAARQVRDVSLGSGIALVGLGLAFLALRMRRVN
ncbi:hypothetical protein ACFWFI_42170 [Streptomyces sp. NPDC060209]|uniref:hypothetical protein n=1 Tax=Streptomyces sp. NPDC060209 TaxID=3347073 RepID=UPI00364A89F3